MPDHAAKLGPQLKFAILDVADPMRSVTPLNLLVQIEGTLTDDRRREFVAADADIRTTAGDVLTVTLPAGRLAELADLDCVVYVELSAPLAPEEAP